jgi:hypothetical protein
MHHNVASYLRPDIYFTDKEMGPGMLKNVNKFLRLNQATCVWQNGDKQQVDDVDKFLRGDYRYHRVLDFSHDEPEDVLQHVW